MSVNDITVKDKLFTVSKHAILLITSFLFIFPVLFIIITSLKDSNFVLSSPGLLDFRHITLENYFRISNSSLRLWKYFWNSTMITVSALTAVVFVGAAAGYGFAKYKFPGRKIMLLLIVMIMTFPVGAIVIPLFIAEFKIGLLDTIIGLILPNISINLPFSIFIMQAVYMTIPSELMDSAEIDGCTPFRTWWEIMLPLSKNGLLVIAALYFGVIWGEFTIGKTLSLTAHSMPLAVGFTLLKGENWDYALMSAIILVGILPSILVFLFFRRYIQSGMTIGAVKG